MFALIKNGVVVQVQPYEEPGFVAVPAGTVCGMVQNADGTFSAPGSTLAQAQTAQITLLRSSCQSAITGGFMSSALGSVYSYPSDPPSQSNLNAVAGSPSGGSLWCEAGGVWAMKPHTQAQAQAVLASFVAWLNSCQTQLATLTGEVQGDTTVSAVQAIMWTAP